MKNLHIIYPHLLSLLVTFLTHGISISNAQNTGSVEFPKIKSDKYTKEFDPSDFKSNSGGFLNMNPDFLQTGKYRYIYSDVADKSYDRNFSNKNYQAILSKSSNTLEKYSTIQVLFSDFIPHHVAGGIAVHRSFRMSDLQNGNTFKLSYATTFANGEKVLERTQNTNNQYKQSIGLFLQSKKARSFFINDLLDESLNFSDSLSHSLILLFTLDDAQNMNNSPGKKYPDFMCYSLSVLNAKGEVLKRYGQVMFFKSIWDRSNIDCLDATIVSAFTSLMNQFLNDSDTKTNLENISNQMSKLPDWQYAVVNGAQNELLKVMIKKRKIIKQLESMGHSTEGINGGGYIDPDDMTTKSYKLSDSQNQLVNSGGHLATTLANTIAVSKQNQLLQEYTYSAALLEDDYNNLNEEEKQISESFSKYLDLASFQLLPNNPSLDKEKERATQNFNNKAKDANQKIEKRQNTIKSDMDSQNKGTTLSSQSAALTNSNNTVESNDKTINTNADEVQKCAEEMKAIWQNSVEYKNYKNNPDCQKMAYIAMRKLPEIALQHCISYMQQNDIDGHKKMINSYNELINSLEDCRNYFGGN